MQQQRLVLDSQTPPPALAGHAHSPAQSVQGPAAELPHYGSVIKQTNRLPPTPPLYSGGATVKPGGELLIGPSVIRSFVATTSSSMSSASNSGNPLSIQGLLSQAPPPRPYGNTSHMIGHGPFLNHPPYAGPYGAAAAAPPRSSGSYMPTPRPAYPPMYHSASHGPPPHGLHSPYPAPHHGPPLRPTSSYQHAGFPQAFAAAAAAAANAEEERRIYR